MTTRFRLEVLCGSSDDVGRARRFFIFLGTYVDGWLADLNTAYSLPSWFSLAAFQPIPIELPAFINQYNIFKYHRIPLLPIGLVVHSLPAWNIRTYWHILIISCSIPYMLFLLTIVPVACIHLYFIDTALYYTQRFMAFKLEKHLVNRITKRTNH